MPDYDFHSLNDKEFEHLCTDLIGVVHATRLERFKAGKDLGVDGRYFAGPGKEVILQCKHWPKSELSALIRHLRDKEAPKVALLKPSRYLLALSHELSRQNKLTIANAMSPYIASPDDIFGREDLNQLLGQSSDIERRYYKLWITSSGVLGYFLNKPILDRSANTIEEARLDAPVYVETSYHSRAVTALDQRHNLILTGEPGVGKTTLAKQLCLLYAAKGFQILTLSSEISEAESVYGDQSERQLFYFDDFLGQNLLEGLNGHSGSQVTQFMKRVKRDANKRFLLTSRTTILNQAKQLVSPFNTEDIARDEFELQVGHLSLLEKGQILYNHIWHSDLSDEYKDQLFTRRRYKEVVKHTNFNPRLISLVTDASRIQEVSATGYWNFVEASLNNPEAVWEHAFTAQQDDFSRAIVMLVLFNGGKILERSLSSAYASYLELLPGLQGRRDFLGNIKHLTGSLLSRTYYGPPLDYAEIKLFNPSLGDYLLQRLKRDDSGIAAFIAAIKSVESVQYLEALVARKILKSESAIAALTIILQRNRETDFADLSPAYLANVCTAAISLGADAKAARLIAHAAQLIVLCEPPSSFLSCCVLVQWGISNATIPPDDAISFVRNCTIAYPDKPELGAMMGIIETISGDDPTKAELTDKLRATAIASLGESLKDEFELSDVMQDVEYGGTEVVEENLERLITSWFEDIGLGLDSFEMREMIACYDVEDQLYKYLRNSSAHDYQLERGGASHSYSASQGIVGLSADAQLDDLFDRS